VFLIELMLVPELLERELVAHLIFRDYNVIKGLNY